MTTKHTPGPWRLRPLIDNTLAVYGSGEYDIVFPKRGGPMDADARLIAAAPDLLKALKPIADIPEVFWRNYPDDRPIMGWDNHKITAGHVRAARAAIAKATNAD